MITPSLHSLFLFVGPLMGLLAAAPATPPVSDFVRRPDISAASISEDGRYVSFLTPGKKDFFDLNVYNFETKESKKFDLGGDDVMGAEWIDAHRMILTTRNRPQYRFRQQVFDVRLGKITGNLTYKLDKGLMGQADTVLRVISSLRRDPNLFTAWFFDYDGERSGLATISLKLQPKRGPGHSNARYNVKEWIDLPPGEFHGAYPDHDGEIRLVALYRDKVMRFHHRATARDEWRPLPLDFETVSILGFDADPDCLYLARYSAEAVSSQLHRYRISTNELGPVLFEDPDYSMSEARLLTRRQANGKPRILALVYERDVQVQRAIDPEFAAVQQAINARLPGRINLIRDCDGDLQRFLVASETSREPTRYVVYDRAAGTFLPMPPPAPWLNPAQMSVMRPVRFPTRDGLMLEGYLSLPPAAAGEGRPPLVVYAHGGPWVRDVWQFDPTVQLLTSRGYAVFQPNYRGSSGYSRRVSKDDEFEFRKMHDDVTDGVRHLVAQGVVDERRLAIVGGSFGGFLAVAGAAFEPGLYRCAVTFAGVFDWEQMIRQHKSDAADNRFNYEYLLKRLGDPARQQDRFEQNSPINRVAGIKAAVFVIHGKLDRTVDVRQSTRLLAELEAHGVPHEKLFFDTEFHGFVERENRQKYLEAVEQFLSKHL